MRKRAMPLLAVSIAMALIAGATGSAMALTVSPAGNVTFTGAPLIFTSSIAEVVCEPAMEADLLEGPIRGEEGNPLGTLDGGESTACSEGPRTTVDILPSSDIVLQEILRNGGQIVGKLYIIRNFRILLAITLITSVNCLYEGDVGVLARVNDTGQVSNGVVLPDQNTLQLSNAGLNSFLCPQEKEVEGILAVEPEQTLED